MTAASTAPDLSVGVVGPMGSGGLNLPGVEKAMMELEGGTVEDMKEKFARLGRRVSHRVLCFVNELTERWCSGIDEGRIGTDESVVSDWARSNFSRFGT